MTRTLHVLGGGAIGQIIAHELRLEGHNVQLLVRRPMSELTTIQTDYTPTAQAKFTALGQAVKTESRSELELGSSGPDGPPIDCLVVTAKAFDIPGALKNLGSRLRADSCVVLVHNGLMTQSARELAPNVDPQNLLDGTTMLAAYVKAKPPHAHVVATGLDFTRIGPYDRPTEGLQRSANAEFLLQALTSAKTVPFVLMDSAGFYRAQRIKLAVNAPYSPVTAIMNTTNGDTASPEEWKRVSRCIVAEVAAIYEVERVALQLGEPDPALQLEAMVDHGAKAMLGTYNSFSSTLQDVRHGRPHELSYINGSICELGRRYGIPTPCNELVQKLVDLRVALGTDAFKF